MARNIYFLAGLIGCALACSDDDDDNSNQAACAPIDPCGGDVVGTWEVQSFCLEQGAAAQALSTPLPAACSDAFVSAEATPDGVTQEFSADGTMTATGTVTLHNEYRFTEACLTALEPELPNLEAACQRVIAGNFSGIQFEQPDQWELSCSESNGACACDGVATVDMAGSESYTLDNGQLVMGSDSTPYCVSGNLLEVATTLIGGNATSSRR